MDYLQRVGRASRIFGCVASVGAAAICFLFAVIGCIGLSKADASEADRKTAWFIVIFFGLLGIATAAIGYRVARGIVSQNRITTMPTWFIQGFGVFLFIGLALAIYTEGNWMLAIEGASLAAAMILVSRRIAERSAKEPNKAVQPTTTSVMPRANERKIE